MFPAIPGSIGFVLPKVRRGGLLCECKMNRRAWDRRKQKAGGEAGRCMTFEYLMS
ncbi:MAG: hypothetical protein ABI561_23195 [Bradyrhizobium sp.]